MGEPLMSLDLGMVSPLVAQQVRRQIQAFLDEARTLPVYELVFSTDEAYYTVGHFASKEDAERVAATGQAAVSDRYNKFEVHERKVLVGGDWTLDEIKMELEGKMGEVDDYFDYPVEDGE